MKSEYKRSDYFSERTLPRYFELDERLAPMKPLWPSLLCIAIAVACLFAVLVRW